MKLTINWDTIVSILIGGGITLAATFIAHWLERRRTKCEQKKLMFGFIQGIYDEVKTLWDSYNENMGILIENIQPKESFGYYWPITQEYFTVYVNNAHLIGQINDHNLRKQIVSTYTKAKGLIDSYLLNNDLIQKHDQAELIYAETQKEIDQTYARIIRERLVEYAVPLKKSHLEVKESVESLLDMLEKEKRSRK